MPDPRLPDCAFPHCDHTSLPDSVMCRSHDHVTIAASGSWVEPAERNQT